MLRQETLESISEFLLMYARDFWERADCVHDFCIQNEASECIVFGSTNRVIWSIKHGFIVSISHCTTTFLIANRNFISEEDYNNAIETHKRSGYKSRPWE